LLKTSEFLMLRFNIFKLAAVGAFLVVLLYSWTAGMGVPVLRAMLMAFFFLLAMLLGKQKDLYHVLAMAALMILLISPEAIWEISFQLSFVSVLAIIYIVPQYSDVSFLQTDVLPGWSKVFLNSYIFQHGSPLLPPSEPCPLFCIILTEYHSFPLSQIYSLFPFWEHLHYPFYCVLSLPRFFRLSLQDAL